MLKVVWMISITGYMDIILMNNNDLTLLFLSLRLMKAEL